MSENIVINSKSFWSQNLQMSQSTRYFFLFEPESISLPDPFHGIHIFLDKIGPNVQTLFESLNSSP